MYALAGSVPGLLHFVRSPLALSAYPSTLRPIYMHICSHTTHMLPVLQAKRVCTHAPAAHHNPQVGGEGQTQ